MGERALFFWASALFQPGCFGKKRASRRQFCSFWLPQVRHWVRSSSFFGVSSRFLRNPLPRSVWPCFFLPFIAEIGKIAIIGFCLMVRGRNSKQKFGQFHDLTGGPELRFPNLRGLQRICKCKSWVRGSSAFCLLGIRSPRTRCRLLNQHDFTAPTERAPSRKSASNGVHSWRRSAFVLFNDRSVCFSTRNEADRVISVPCRFDKKAYSDVLFPKTRLASRNSP
jgi:hypothetical protein